jgi:methylase of polypeptide subunit release factors
MATNLRDIYVGVKQNNLDRNENDLYPTPPLATYVLHKYIDLPQNIVEPCAGRGNISVELMRGGHNVKSYDLHEYKPTLCEIETGIDVLTLHKPERYDALVTNPPYHKDLPRKIAEKGVSEYDLTALFVRLTYLEGKKRNLLFTKNTPSDIIFLSDRIRFGTGLLEPINKKDQIGGMIAYAWVVFNKKTTHENTKLRWVLLEDEYDEWRKLYDKCSNTSGR